MSLNLIFHISDFHNSKIVNNILFFFVQDLYIYIYIYIYISLRTTGLSSKFSFASTS